MSAATDDYPPSPLLTMTTPNRFNINVSDELLRLTRQKLESARFPHGLQDAGWQDGTPTAEVR